MNKTEFMAQLKKHLRKLPFDEVKEAVDYYEQYFFEAGAENEQAVIKELGPPSVIASQIFASFAVKDSGKSAKKGLSTVWMAILAVFASPVALPLALAVIALAFALVIIMLSVVFALGGLGAGLAAGGIMSVITSISIIRQSFPSSIFFFGLGLIAAGSGLVVLIGTVNLAKISFNWLTKNIGGFILRRNRK